MDRSGSSSARRRPARRGPTALSWVVGFVVILVLVLVATRSGEEASPSAIPTPTILPAESPTPTLLPTPAPLPTATPVVLPGPPSTPTPTPTPTLIPLPTRRPRWGRSRSRPCDRRGRRRPTRDPLASGRGPESSPCRRLCRARRPCVRGWYRPGLRRRGSPSARRRRLRRNPPLGRSRDPLRPPRSPPRGDPGRCGRPGGAEVSRGGRKDLSP